MTRDEERKLITLSIKLAETVNLLNDKINELQNQLNLASNTILQVHSNLDGRIARLEQWNKPNI